MLLINSNVQHYHMKEYACNIKCHIAITYFTVRLYK